MFENSSDSSFVKTVSLLQCLHRSLSSLNIGDVNLPPEQVATGDEINRVSFLHRPTLLCLAPGGVPWSTGLAGVFLLSGLLWAGSVLLGSISAAPAAGSPTDLQVGKQGSERSHDSSQDPT